jgi:putative ABC transport system permease protein
MRTLLVLALRNLLRYKRRTILTLLLLSVGIAFLVFQSGMVKGWQEQSYENLIDFETGHLKLRHAGFDADAPLAVETLLTDSADLRTRLAALPFVTGAAERLVFQAEVEGDGEALPCLVTGFDPLRDKDVFSLAKALATGTLGTNGVLLGAGLARDLAVDIGGTVYLTFRTGAGMINSVALPVEGIIASSDPQADRAAIYLDLHRTRALLKTDGAGEIALRTVDRERTAEFRERLSAEFPGLAIGTWQELGAYVTAAAEADSFGHAIFVFFLSVIALVGLVNTMLMSVFEKRAEIGMLKALGMREREVLGIFVLEGVLIGAGGALLGVLLGGLVNGYFVVHGIDMAAFLGDADISIGYRVGGVVHNRFDWFTMGGAFVIAVVASTLAALYPARAAVRLTPAEALRTI